MQRFRERGFTVTGRVVYSPDRIKGDQEFLKVLEHFDDGRSIPVLVFPNLDAHRGLILRWRKKMSRSTLHPTSSAPGSRCADRVKGILASPPAHQRTFRASATQKE